jgi:hypothetical protein
MVGSPAPFRLRKSHTDGGIHGSDLAYLKPAPNDVRPPPGPPKLLVEPAKQPPEDKQVASANTVLMEMPSSASVLAKRRPPTRASRTHLGTEVGVKVGTDRALNFPLCQVFDESSEMAASPLELLIANWGGFIWNRHGEH